MHKQTRWSTKEKEYLQTHYMTRSDAEIAKVLERSEDSVKDKRHREGLFKNWTKEQEEKLSKMYEEGYTDKEISEAIGVRSKTAVTQRRFKLGLTDAHVYKNEKIYVVYQNDYPIANGTMQEIAHSQGVGITTVYGWIRGRVKSIEMQEVN